MSHQAADVSYARARQQFADWQVDTDGALRRLAEIPISLHCWQGDDVRGFEPGVTAPGGGLAVTGSYPGRARNADELRADLEFVSRLLPGPQRINLHASYAETWGRPVERDELDVSHFRHWLDWAESHGFGLDFNPTFFAHRWAESGATLSHVDPSIRQFWVNHGIACRRIAAAIGRRLGSPSVNNLWIPDGSKDLPYDRRAPRERLCQSLDEIYAEALSGLELRDAVESKLFGLGSESYVVGSHEFYLGYAIRRQLMLCLDAGHFHPTESIADKLSAVLPWIPEVLLHVSRGVRWDSDHVVILNDDVRAITEEAVRGDYLGQIRWGLDFFDASINRTAAWLVGARSLQQALLAALLEPRALLAESEARGDHTARLMLFAEIKTLPFGVVWQEYCRRADVPWGLAGLEAVRRYERDVLSRRTE